MSGLRRIILKPIHLVIDPLERFVKRKLAGLIEACLEPVRNDLKVLNAKMDQVLDINVAPEVLQDFRAHNETLRAIQADCDLVRDMNPMFNSFLRDLMRLQLQCEEMSSRLDPRLHPATGREQDAA